MRVGKIGHAGVVVASGPTCCFMDPVFFSPFEGGATAFAPALTVDTARARALCTLIVISHAHGDHFCPRSLNVFRRSCPVIYPAGAHGIERALDRLGFQFRLPLEVRGHVEVSGLTLTATGSVASFPEMGLLFAAEGQVFWNQVDSVLDESILAAARAAAGRPPDLLFANFQPLIEAELTEDALGAGFPFATYGDRLRQTLDLRPRCVVPASFGVRYAGPHADWLNLRGVPMTEAQFLADLALLDPGLQTLRLPPGGVLEIGEQIRRSPEGLDFVTPEGGPAASDFRPDLGVPPLRDGNPLGVAKAALETEVGRFLDGPFLAQLRAADPLWLEKLARLRVRWELEVVYPDGRASRWLDFAKPALAWAGAGSTAGFAKLHTSITGSALHALERGQLPSYAIEFNQIRVVNRLYEVHRGGVSRAGGRADEPITKLLLRGADDRYLDRELDAILADAG